MPELPETETIARDLNAAVRGTRIVRTVVLRADVLRETDAHGLAGATNGAEIERVWRRAKLVVLDLRASDGDLWHLVVQPRFTGSLLIVDRRQDRDGSRQGNRVDSAPTHITVTFDLSDGRLLHYRDVRRLGTVALMSAARFAAYAGALGPEPLDPAFSATDVSALLRSSSRAIKIALMDQRTLAGVGNIYANEALWRAGIDPSREAGSLASEEAHALFAALQQVLEASIEARGTSFRDYRDAHGNRGAFVEQLAVYGRAGLPCQRCGRKLVGTHAVDGRSTVFCATCQR